MKQFFKQIFASCLGVLIAGFLLLFIFFGIIGSLIPSEEPTVEVKNNSVLLLKLDKPIYDREVNDLSMFGDIVNGEVGSSIGLTEFLQVMKRAKGDENIKAIMLDLSLLQANGWATIEEMRQSIEDFKTSGKKVYAYSDMLTQSAYYLATAADEIIMNPNGMLTLTGLGAEVMYYKDLLNKFDIDVELIRPKNNSYKSAGETYISNKMSEENREQIKAYLAAIWDYVSDKMVRDRKLDKAMFEQQVSNLETCLPNDALKNKLIDKVSFRSDVEDLICSEIRTKHKLSKSTQIDFVKYSKYRKSIPIINEVKQENIAVIYAYGDVNQGKGTSLSIGSETLVKAIRKATENKTVKAIVLRVNSPGGDAIASELITNEVIRAKKVKPVIVSMGDVAASAGYEMSSNATKIVAMPVTITGSIGVFGVMPNFARTLKTNFGITFDTVKTHQNSVLLSVTTPPSKDVMMLMQRNVENCYANFINRV
ncbi:MAG: signal peptide peptidase SppA, partial [Bacteroidales bacterium]|nr:signal peptide peptidase SppA [Bacteroidales bacterium]